MSNFGSTEPFDNRQQEQDEHEQWEFLTEEEKRRLQSCDDVRKDFEKLLQDPAFKAEYEREMRKL